MKILYLMQVDWNWIKQRPHFIVEEMVKNGIEVDVYYNKCFYKKLLTPNIKGDFIVKQIPRLPLSRFAIVREINKWLYKCVLKRVLKHTYDYAYLTHPLLYNDVINIPIVYDCMDNWLGFSQDEAANSRTFAVEKNLVKKAKYISFTSEYLRDTVVKRYNLDSSDNRFFISNNAIGLPTKLINEKVDLGESKRLKFVYIGAIANWFDFDLLSKLDKNKYEFHLFGPIEYTGSFIIPDNFIFHGSIPRENVFSVMNAGDILIMPFIVNELIKAVKPVKLYEYIYSRKPIISVKYGETEKFSEYVYLYENSNAESFMSCVKQIENNKLKGKSSAENCIAFAKNNTWTERAKEILKILNERRTS